MSRLNPENFYEGTGGMAEDFRGTIVDAYLHPFNYDGNRAEYVCALHLEIEPAEGQTLSDGLTPITADTPGVHIDWSAGTLLNLVPSNDGITPAGGDLEFYNQLAAGLESIGPEEAEKYRGEFFAAGSQVINGSVFKGDQEKASKEVVPKKSSNVYLGLQSLSDCGFTADESTKELIGLDCQFVRVPRPGASDLPQDEGKRKPMITLVNQIYGEGGGVRKTTASDTAAAGDSAADSSSSELSAEVGAVLIGLLAEKEGNSAARTTLIKPVTDAFQGAQKAAAVGAIKDAASSTALAAGVDGLIYDAEKDTFSIG